MSDDTVVASSSKQSKPKKELTVLDKARRAAGLKLSEILSHNDSYLDKVVFVTLQGQKIVVPKE